MPLSKFDDAESEKQSSSTTESSSTYSDKEYQSIRNKNRKKYSESDNDGGEKKEKYSFNFTFDERVNYYENIDETKEYLMEKKFKLDQYKQENIERFLFTKAPVPRSYRMIGNLIFCFLISLNNI